MHANAFVERHFGTALSPGRFLLNVALLSILSLLPFTILHVFRTAGFATLVMNDATAAGLVLRQIATNGFPVVFIINAAGFVLYGSSIRRAVPLNLFLMGDALGRGLLFVLIHLFVYLFSADLFGSFGGSRTTAIDVLGPTLSRAYAFDTISGAYLYALLPGAVLTYAAWLTEAFEERARWAEAAAILFLCLLIFGVVTALSGVMIWARAGI
jgi:hypothetical protein